ncbi:MAG: hypothetical protein U0X75_19255 [Acidobacteriota bacterium]
MAIWDIAKVGGDHPRAVLLIEEAITIYRRITDAWSEGIVMGWQGESFFQLELGDAAIAAMWQARVDAGIRQLLQQQFDELFAQFAQSGNEARTLLDALPTEAETIRQESNCRHQRVCRISSEGKKPTNETPIGHLFTGGTISMRIDPATGGAIPMPGEEIIAQVPGVE